jgi:hypothetical protein
MSQKINHDNGKTKWHLLPYDALEQVARVLTQACTREKDPYDPRSWEQGMDWSRAFDSAQRHARDFAAGERLDHETGLPVAAHAAFRWLQILAYQLRQAGTDDMTCVSPKPIHETQVERVIPQWECMGEAVYRGYRVTLLNRSSLEPDRWVVRSGPSGATFYANESDLTPCPPTC